MALSWANHCSKNTSSDSIVDVLCSRIYNIIQMSGKETYNRKKTLFNHTTTKPVHSENNFIRTETLVKAQFFHAKYA
jgi:hypothetical protein